jgi:hypothetical protein
VAKWGDPICTVSFVNWDGKELQSITVSSGDTPVYSGDTPQREATAQRAYTFSGWEPEIAAAWDDAVYKAAYTESARTYTVKFLDWDGTELQRKSVAYGDTPAYSGKTPARAAEGGTRYNGDLFGDPYGHVCG